MPICAAASLLLLLLTTSAGAAQPAAAAAADNICSCLHSLPLLLSGLQHSWTNCCAVKELTAASRKMLNRHNCSQLIRYCHQYQQKLMSKVTGSMVCIERQPRAHQACNHMHCRTAALHCSRAKLLQLTR
jgi:hypothetical protein